MSEWQPIETAPRDGTRVVLATPDASRFPDGWRFHVDYWRKYRDDHGEGWGRIVDWPTHWMPLPAPPEPTKETR